MEEKNKGGFSGRQGRDRRAPASGRNHFTRRKNYSGGAEKVDFSSGNYENGERRNRNYRSRGHEDNREGGRKEYSGNRQDGGRSYGSSRSYGSGRSFGGDRGFGSARSYGSDRSYGNDRSYGSDRSYGNDRSYGDRNHGDRPRSERPYGERRSYGSPKPYGAAKKFVKQENAGINAMIKRRPQIDQADSDNDSVSVPVKDVIRLNRFIANSGICSRREADNLILAGTVTVNGEVVTELGTKVNIYTDDIRFNGERLKGEDKVYIVMNKPKGYVTTVSDPHADKTVMDLLKGCKMRVFPVGRLDKNTTGVLMFTNDGEIAEKLTHPSYDKKKIYQVIVDTPLREEDREKVLAGIELSDGTIRADELEYVDAEDRRKLGIEIHSGKNRIVRRIFESLGYEVRALDRVYFAGLTKKGLKKGEWRYLTAGEVNILRMGAYV